MVKIRAGTSICGEGGTVTEQTRPQGDDSHTSLGIELGSTRITSVLVDDDGQILASGFHGWKTKLVDQMWSYRLEDVWDGIAESFAVLADDFLVHHHRPLITIGAIGVSAMMHGYLAFDADNQLLVPFRTWRNTCTRAASDELCELFGTNIPQYWSIAHLHQAVLSGEEHVGQVDYLTTLAGCVHWQLTGRKVLGVGDASGMFPLNAEATGFDTDKLAAYDALIEDRDVGWRLADLLPEVLVAGQPAGVLSAEGASLLDPLGNLQPGIPACPPEGDAGTGMVATNSVRPRTGSVSAGTGLSATVVLEHPLGAAHPQIDLVATPSGEQVAMVRTDNCVGDLNAWIGLFAELLETAGAELSSDELCTALFERAMAGDPDCGGMLSYNYVSAEHTVDVDQGHPLFVRSPTSSFTLANFMRLQLSSAFATLRLAMDVLLKDEGVALDTVSARGDIFHPMGAPQRVLSAALDTPVSVERNADAGGAWGMALLASYMRSGAKTSLADHLDTILSASQTETVRAAPVEVEGFSRFIEHYRAGLAIERSVGAAFTG